MTAFDADDLYRALVGDPVRLRTMRRLQYRCADQDHSCLLLDAVDTGKLGVLLHQKRYKFSPGVNEQRSSEEGRRANTYDGSNHWISHSYFIEQSVLGQRTGVEPKLDINCDHVLDYPLTPDEFHRDLEAGHAEVVVRADHSRFAK